MRSFDRPRQASPGTSLEVDRLRRGALDGASLAPDTALDRAEQPGSPAGRGEHREEEEGCRRLPVRPRDRRDRELARRLPEEGVRGGRHGRARVGDDQLRDGRSSSSGRSTTSATAPRSTASAAKSWPSARSRERRRTDRPGRTRELSYASPPTTSGAPSRRRAAPMARLRVSSSIGRDSSSGGWCFVGQEERKSAILLVFWFRRTHTGAPTAASVAAGRRVIPPPRVGLWADACMPAWATWTADGGRAVRPARRARRQVPPPLLRRAKRLRSVGRTSRY